MKIFSSLFLLTFLICNSKVSTRSFYHGEFDMYSSMESDSEADQSDEKLVNEISGEEESLETTESLEESQRDIVFINPIYVGLPLKFDQRFVDK